MTMLVIFSCVAFVAGYVGAIFSWPGIRAHAVGAAAEITALRARAAALEDRIKGVL
jgi:hypothetical protein